MHGALEESCFDPVPRRVPWLRRIRFGLVALVGAAAMTMGAAKAYFVVQLDATAQIIPAGTTPTTLDIADFAEPNLFGTPAMSAQGASAHDMSSVKAYQAELVLQQPTLFPSLAFAGTVRVVAQAPGLPDVTIAQGTADPNTSNLLVLAVQPVELLAYAKHSEFSLSVHLANATAPSTDVVVRALLGLEVSVNQPGTACWQR